MLYYALQVANASSDKPTTKECQVCFDAKPNEGFQSIYGSSCLHKERSICDDCVYQHVKSALDKMCTDDVRCPELNCGITFDYMAVKDILSKHNDKKLKEKYDQFVLHRELERMPEFIWCAHGCSMGQLNEGGDGNNIVTCAKCCKKTCFTHKIKWHSGLTCAQFDALKDPALYATERWIAQQCKRCPNCSSLIEKEGGCDHMTCAFCNYEFCWSCFADYNGIRRDGNHRHAPDCKHYAPYRR